MLVCLAAAVVILLVVALPKFREGAPFLTEEGEEALAEARRRTRALAAQARDRAAEAAQQAAEQAKAARERVATLTTADEDDGDTQDDRGRDDATQLSAPEPAAESVDVRDAVHGNAVHENGAPAAGTDHVIDLRDGADGLDGHLNGQLSKKRGAHRKLNDITFGEPLPGPRHGR